VGRGLDNPLCTRRLLGLAAAKRGRPPVSAFVPLVSNPAGCCSSDKELMGQQIHLSGAWMELTACTPSNAAPSSQPIPRTLGWYDDALGSASWRVATVHTLQRAGRHTRWPRQWHDHRLDQMGPYCRSLPPAMGCCTRKRQHNAEEEVKVQRVISAPRQRSKRASRSCLGSAVAELGQAKCATSNAQEAELARFSSRGGEAVTESRTQKIA